MPLNSWPTALLSLGLMANLAPIATFAAVLPEVSATWDLSASRSSIGPVAVGVALDAFGGGSNPAGWSAAFVTMALGSSAAILAMQMAPRLRMRGLPAPDSGNGNRPPHDGTGQRHQVGRSVDRERPMR